MAKRLYVITSNYPFRYNGGEIPFITLELEYMNEYFPDVVFVPLNPIGERVDGGRYTVDSSLGRRCRRATDLASVFRIFTNRNAFAELTTGILGGIASFRRAVLESRKILYARSWAREIIRREGANAGGVFYSYWLIPPIYGIAEASIGTSWTVVSRAHGGDLYEDRHLNARFEYRDGYLSLLDGIFPISEDGARHLESRYPECSDKIKTYHLGTPSPDSINKPSNDGVLRVLSCSSLKSLKRVPAIANILSRLAERMPGRLFEWTHIGGGQGYEELFAQVTEYNQPNLKINLPGAFGHQEVIDFYRCHPVDVFLNYSESEGVPVSIQEAISYGIPVIAPDLGGMREIVNEDSGFLLPASASQADVVDLIMSLIIEPRKLSSKRNTARATWDRHFSAAKNNKSFFQGLALLAQTRRA